MDAKTESQELISIIVPVYNIKEYLEHCVNSILNQTWKNLEILLVDDGSTDGTDKLVDELGKKDARIRVFHKKNGGSSSARNLGIREAHGAYLGFVDSDDYIEPFMYEKLYEAIIKSGMPIAQGGRQEIDERGNILPDICIPPEKLTIYDSHDFMRELLLHKGDCSFCTKLTDASLFKERKDILSAEEKEIPVLKNGGFPEGKLNEDFHVLVKMLPNIPGIVSIPERVYHVFYKSGSNTRTESSEAFSRVYGDNVENADMVTEIVCKEYPELFCIAERFGFYQRLDYLLHIPIGQMVKGNRQYNDIIRYLRRTRGKMLGNAGLTKKQKIYLTMFSVAPVLIRKAHKWWRG